MEARVAKLESDVAHIQRDIGEIKGDIREIDRKIFRHFLILGAMIIAAFLILAGMLSTGFFRLSDRMDAQADKTESSFKLILDRLPARKP